MPLPRINLIEPFEIECNGVIYTVLAVNYNMTHTNRLLPELGSGYGILTRGQLSIVLECTTVHGEHDAILGIDPAGQMSVMQVPKKQSRWKRLGLGSG
jgi:hypothetical protein